MTDKLELRKHIMSKLANHPFLKRTFSKLTNDEWQFITDWLEENKELDPDALMSASNRLFLDTDPTKRPKNWKIICEFTSCLSTQIKSHEVNTHPTEA